MTEGYDSPIPQGLWRRVTTYGIPTPWFAIWIGAAVLQSMLLISWLRWPWGVILTVLVLAGEFFGGQYLTRADMQWDELCLAQWTRRYHHYYD